MTRSGGNRTVLAIGSSTLWQLRSEKTVDVAMRTHEYFDLLDGLERALCVLTRSEERLAACHADTAVVISALRSGAV